MRANRATEIPFSNKDKGKSPRNSGEANQPAVGQPHLPVQTARTSAAAQAMLNQPPTVAIAVIIDRVTSESPTGIRVINFEAIKGLTNIEKSVLREHVEAELTTYFVSLRNALMSGLLKAIRLRTFNMPDGMLHMQCNFFLIQLWGRKEFLDRLPLGFEASKNAVNQYLRRATTRSLLTLSEVREYGWPTTLGVVFDPEQESVSNSLNCLLSALGSNHRLATYTNFEDMKACLAKWGINDPAQIQGYIDNSPAMVFEYGQVKLPIEKVQGVPRFEIEKMIASSPFYSLRLGSNNGEKIILNGDLIFLINCNWALTYFCAEEIADRPALQKLCQQILIGKPKDLTTLAKELTTLAIEFVRYHEEGHCALSQSDQINNDDQAGCESVMNQAEALMIELLADLAPRTKTLAGVYQYIFSHAKADDLKRKQKARLLLLMKLAELEEHYIQRNGEGTTTHLIELPLLAEIFPNQSRIDLTKFGRLWQTGLFEELLKITQTLLETYKQAFAQGIRVAKPVSMIEKHSIEDNPDQMNLLFTMLQTMMTKKIIPKLRGKQ